MCLYSRIGRNPRYQRNKKNKGIVPIPTYDVLRGVEYKCGVCIECRKERGNSWRVRLQEELKEHKKAMFVTLTFSDESIKELIESCDGVDEANTVATKAIRRFLERRRKKTGKSIKHWFIVEIGGNSTERIHIHGLIFGEIWKPEELQRLWKYGRTDIGYECSVRTINYITKYLTKVDEKHKDFISVVLTSPGIGKEYIRKHRVTHAFRFEKTETKYRDTSGAMISLPKYYKDKLWTEEEREDLRVIAMALNGDKKRVGKTEYIVRTREDITIFMQAKAAYIEAMERLGFPTPWARKERKYRAINNAMAEWRKKLYQESL